MVCAEATLPSRPTAARVVRVTFRIMGAAPVRNRWVDEAASGRRLESESITLSVESENPQGRCKMMPPGGPVSDEHMGKDRSTASTSNGFLSRSTRPSSCASCGRELFVYPDMKSTAGLWPSAARAFTRSMPLILGIITSVRISDTWSG